MNTNINIISGEPRFKSTQKCFIPTELLKSSNFKIGDYICIKCASITLLCRIFIQTSSVMSFIFADDTVFYNLDSDEKKFKDNNNMKCHYPNDFQLVETSSLRKLSVKIVFTNDKRATNLEVPETIIRQILSPFVIGKGVTIKCVGQKLADIFCIDSIVILSSFEQSTGKLSGKTKIEIGEVTTVKQTINRTMFGNMELGGMSKILKNLQISLLESSYRKLSKCVIVTGPSGSGKSSIVRKFLGESNVFNVLIDGIENCNIEIEDCNTYCEQFQSALQGWPERSCILFIDHIDRLAPVNFENGRKFCEIIYLMRKLADYGVLIIAASPNRKILHAAVNTLFDKEIKIGMPSLSNRKEIVEMVVKTLEAGSVNCQKIAQLTPGYVGADIVALCTEALRAKRDTENFCYQTLKPSCREGLTTEELEKALMTIEPTALKTSKWNLKVKPIHWNDIGGMKDIKKRLQMCIEWPLHHPEAFQKVGLPCPRGLLLFGPPGCCKTTLARGLATECNANFFAASPSQIYSPYVGESEKNIVELFQQARLCAPSIIFLDELDSLVGQRKFDTKIQGISEKVLSALLNEMDGFATKSSSYSEESEKILEGEMLPIDEQVQDEQCSNNKVIVVAATNRPDLIDDALLRPGRFDVILYAAPPDVEERVSILKTLTSGAPIKDVNMKFLADKTELFSGADLKNLCDMAGISALRLDSSAEFLTEDHFLQALKEVQPSITKEQILMYERLASKYGPVITSIK